MLLGFFESIRKAEIPASITEWLAFTAALEKGLAFADVESFYLLARTTLIKDEKYFDRFDLVFAAWFRALGSLDELLEALIPEDWMRADFAASLSAEDKQNLKSLGDLQALIEAFKERLEEQTERHAGGSKWVGTGGTSPFGHGGFHPQGIRVGGPGGQNKATKVWEKRQFRDLDDSVELGTRSTKMALRKLRKFARSGSLEELDLDGTIAATARNAGMLDLRMVPERHNSVKVLLFLDVGGSMDPYIRRCEELFSAARAEFKHMQYFYFHNCVYEKVWQSNIRREHEGMPTWDLLRLYGRDYKAIFVGDASMAPYEIDSRHGSVEHWNEESGQVWLDRMLSHFEKSIWLNPGQEEYWQYTQSVGMIRNLMKGRMFPLTLKGIDRAIDRLLH